MIKVQILDFNKESGLVFTATFEMVRAINSTYDCGNYTLEVNNIATKEIPEILFICYKLNEE